MNELENKILDELSSSPKEYLENCLNNYSDYLKVAQKLFKESYIKMQLFDSEGDPWLRFNSKAEEFRKINDLNKEIELLELAIKKGIYTPYTYERLAIIYSKNKELQKAYRVCKNWFDSPFWMIPNMASTSLKLFERMKKLESKDRKSVV